VRLLDEIGAAIQASTGYRSIRRRQGRARYLAAMLEWNLISLRNTTRSSHASRR
jgi:hypothetical protein